MEHLNMPSLIVPPTHVGTTIPCELITATQFAELLNVSERTLYRLKSTNSLPEPIHLGGSVRWRLAEIRRWIEKGCPVPRDLPLTQEGKTS
jgi:excisionase family DNA binding protein